MKIYRFAGLRPKEAKAAEIASVPYDVVSTEETRTIIDRNPTSFLRVIRSDAEIPGIAPNDSLVYQRARENLDMLVNRGLLQEDPEPGMYIYRVKQGGSIYTGLVACIGVREYVENRIKRHEHTRYDKEEDRTRHIDATNANTGLVFLLYRDPGEIFSYIDSLVPEEGAEGVVKTDQCFVHEIFRISDNEALSRIENLFDEVDSLYIADGHHRAKSAVNVSKNRNEAGIRGDETDRFMAILFAENRVKIHGYSRLVTDFGKYNPVSFLEALSGKFEVKPYGGIDDTVFCIPPLHESVLPQHVIHMYLEGRWYELTKPVKDSSDLIASLDVTVLQEDVLEGMLGIKDPRGDPRLQYLGGARPLKDLEERVDQGRFALAFSMQPVGVETVLAIADSGGIMPPKSTWFEPKLLSGLVLHSLD